MALIWGTDLNIKLTKALVNLKEEGPKHLREIAKELGIHLQSDSDHTSFRYRIKKVVEKEDELEYFGYTGKGYIVPVYYDDYERISKPLRSRGEGMLTKAEKFEKGARSLGKVRENQPEQLTLFDVSDMNG